MAFTLNNAMPQKQHQEQSFRSTGLFCLHITDMRCSYLSRSPNSKPHSGRTFAKTIRYCIVVKAQVPKASLLGLESCETILDFLIAPQLRTNRQFQKVVNTINKILHRKGLMYSLHPFTLFPLKTGIPWLQVFSLEKRELRWTYTSMGRCTHLG